MALDRSHRFTSAATSHKGKRLSEYIARLKQCGKATHLENGKQIHEEVKQIGLHTSTMVANTLITMYSRCRCMELARVVSQQMPRKDVVTWNSLILGYAANGECFKALELFTKMDCQPNHVTFLAALKACTGGKDFDKRMALEKGKAIHQQAKELGHDSNVFVASGLVDMYGKCGDMILAREAFERIPVKGVVAWNSLFMGYVTNGKHYEALKLFTLMDCQPNHVTYLAVLKACASLASEKLCDKARLLVKGRELHEQLRRQGYESHTAVSNTLVDMYGKLGEVDRAREVFDGMKRKDVVSWNCLISGYVQKRQGSVAVEVFRRMDCQPDRFTYLAVVKGCSALSEENTLTALKIGKEIHKLLMTQLLASDIFVATALVDMYGKCRDMASAKEVFDGMKVKNAVTWNNLLLGYVDNGEESKALDLFASMDCEPDHVSFIAALKACSKSVEKGEKRHKALQRGLDVCKQAEERGLAPNVFVGGAMVDMYTKCGDMKSAREVFERMKNRDVLTWTCLVLGYVEQGEHVSALEVFDGMDCKPDSVTFVAALKACSGIGGENGLQRALALYEEVKKFGFERNIVVANALVDTFGKCRNLRLAKEVFDHIITKDVISWNSLFMGYVNNGEGVIPLQLFLLMDCEPNQVTFVAMLKACSVLATTGELGKREILEKGKYIHEQVKEKGFESVTFVANTLIDMYSKLGSLANAKEAFETLQRKDAVSWNCLLLGSVENGESLQALKLYTNMDCKPNRVTLTTLLKACSSLSLENWSERNTYLERGITIHEHVKESGFEDDTVVAGSLVDMYSKCGNMLLARDVFSKMPVRDVVTWTSIILGYVENKESSVALELFRSMDCEPNHLTYFAVLKACGSLADIPFGRAIHARVCRLGLEAERSISTGLVHFYGRSGCMAKALAVFEGMQFPDIASWTGLIAGYGAAGESAHVLRLVEEIKEAGLELSAATFAGILAACSHGGMLEQGEKIFEYMQRNGLSPAVDHYTCMVDMFGRANKLDRAADLVYRMPLKPDEVTWTVLLDACRKWRDPELGRVAFDALLQSGGKRKDSAMPYVVLGELLRS